VTELPDDADLAPLDADAAGRLHAAWASLPRRSRYVLTVRLGLDGHAPLTLRLAADPLDLNPERIRQIQQLALGDLAVAVHGQRAGAEPLRPFVADLLRRAVASGS